MTLGDRLRQAREQKGWSQRELARRVKMAHGRISNLERGINTNPRLKTLEQFAAALDVTVTYFLSEDTVEQRYGSYRVHALDRRHTVGGQHHTWKA